VLEEDVLAAFSRVTDQPFESVYTRRFTARDQVKAIFGTAWLGRREAVPALARHLDDPSLTAASNAAGALERLTGAKFAAEGEVVLLSNESLQRAKDWWRTHSAEFVPAEKGK
jgi:HEAT repeat protein